MKYIKSKKISRQKYELTLEVSDYDLNMLEDFATTYAPNELIEEPSEKNNWNGTYSPDYKDKYRKWLSKTWTTFWKLWHIYDETFDKSDSTKSEPYKKGKEALNRLRSRN